MDMFNCCIMHNMRNTVSVPNMAQVSNMTHPPDLCSFPFVLLDGTVNGIFVTRESMFGRLICLRVARAAAAPVEVTY